MSDRHPLPTPFEDWPRPFAFVLSGGGGFGSAQVGMLRALFEAGVRPDLIVGSSVGALHGAMVATHGPDAVPAMEDLWRRMNRRTVFGRRREILRNVRAGGALASFDRLQALIEREVGAPSFDQLSTKFAAVATDQLTGEPELLADGAVVPALLASAAVPGVFPAVEIGGRRYVDGGVAANVPIRQAISFGAQSVLSLDVTPPEIASTPPRGLSSSLLHSVSLMLRNQRSHAVDDLAHRYRIAGMPSATPTDMGSFNFARTDELLRSSYELAVSMLTSWASDAVSRTDDR